jgi:hypothetical protein
VATFSTICAFTPDRVNVFRFDGTPNAWTKIGFRLGQLYGGDFGLVGTDASGTGEPLGTLLWWRRGMHDFVSHAWHPIGGPGASFAVTPDTVYGLTPDRGAVFRFNPASQNDWTQVGTAASQIYAGPFGLVATDPSTGDLFLFLGTPMNWTQIGGPGASFAVTQDTVFGLTPDRGAVNRYDLRGTSWTQVGGPAAAIFAFNEEVAPDP